MPSLALRPASVPARRRPLAALAAVALLALAPSARALDLDDLDVLQFPKGGMNTGMVDAGPGFDFAIDPSFPRLCTGAGVFQNVGTCSDSTAYDITISQDLKTVHRFPQQDGQQPSAANPFVATSKWTATNQTGEVLPQVLLLFTSVNLASFPGAIAPGGYPDVQVGLDGNLLEIVKWTAMGMDYFFGAVDLGALAPGESKDFLVRYIVSGGPMPIVDNRVVMPPLKLVSVVVPEPGTLALLAAGIAGLAAAGRRR